MSLSSNIWLQVKIFRTTWDKYLHVDNHKSFILLFYRCFLAFPKWAWRCCCPRNSRTACNLTPTASEQKMIPFVFAQNLHCLSVWLFWILWGNGMSKDNVPNNWICPIYASSVIIKLPWPRRHIKPQMLFLQKNSCSEFSKEPDIPKKVKIPT